MQYILRLVTIEKQTTLRVLCYSKMFQTIYQTGPYMAANFTLQAAAIKACSMQNTEECFRQEVWRPEIWYWTERMATCDILESGSIELTLRKDAETLNHRPFIHLNKSCQVGMLETLLSVKELWPTFKSQKISLACNYMAASTMTERKFLGEHLSTRASSYLSSAGIIALLWWGCGKTWGCKWLSNCTRERKIQELMQNQHSNFLWSGCLQYKSENNCTLAPSTASPWLHSNWRCCVNSKWSFKGWNLLRFEMTIKEQRVSWSKYILNLLIRVVRDEWLADSVDMNSANEHNWIGEKRW